MSSAYFEAQLKLYIDKISSLQAQNIIYRDEINRLRSRIILLQDYQIKYQLLLEKNQDQSPLRRSRRIDQINTMNRKIQENDRKWAEKVKNLQKKYQSRINQLQEDNLKLRRCQQKADKETNKVNQTNEDFQILKLKLLQQQQKVIRLNNELLNSKIILQNKISDLQQTLEDKIFKAKQFQKEFYRDTIKNLEQTVQRFKDQIQIHKEKASPQREKQIERLNNIILQLRNQNSEQIMKINQKIHDKNSQIIQLQGYLENYKKQTKQRIFQQQKIIEQLNREKLLKEEDHHKDLMICREQMQKIRIKQMELLKIQFKQVQDSFDLQRKQWQIIIKENENELERIKLLWEQQKTKYLQQKNRLKQKISELKDRLKKTQNQEKQAIQNETFKLIQSLKQIDEFQNKYNDYQSGITFLHRQLKRAAIKIQQKDRDIQNLMKELAQQKKQFDTQINQVKITQRKALNGLKEKLLSVDERNSKLLQQLRVKQKNLKNQEELHQEELAKMQNEKDSLKNIIQEMERDYRRLTDTKKNLYSSYRDQRDNVFTGKAQLNTERKKKWKDLDRQRTQLQIAYKQRQKQIVTNYQIQINALRQKFDQTSKQNIINKEQLKNLSQKYKRETGKGKENTMEQFTKKVATLDLQISLTQNLYDTLRNAKSRIQNSSNINRNKTISDLDSVASHSQESGSMTSRQRKIREMQDMGLDQDDFVHENMAPTFSNPKLSSNKNKNKVLHFPEEGMQISFRPVDSEQKQE